MTRVEELNLGICRAFLFPGTGVGSALVLPGAGYGVQAPLLWFSRLALSAAGRSVLAVDDRYSGEDDARAWVERRALAALDYLAGARPIIVGKSLTTLAAPIAAERRLPAIWLTPLLRLADSPVVAGLRDRAAPALLIGGTADPAWHGDLARSFAGVEVLEIEDGDHSLQMDGNPARSLDALRAVVDSVARFAQRLP